MFVSLCAKGSCDKICVYKCVQSDASQDKRLLAKITNVSCFQHVVDSIVDQDEVTALLNKEKEKKLGQKKDHQDTLDRLKKNYEFLMYNGVKQAK